MTTTTSNLSIPASSSSPGLLGSPASFASTASGDSMRGDGYTSRTLARAQELAAAEAHESLEAAADRGTMRPLTAATAVKQQRERQDAQPGMVWSQDWRSALHGGAPGWRVLTPAENALRARGSLSRAGL